MYRANLGLAGLASAIIGFAVISALRSMDLAVPSPHDLLSACREAVFSGETVVSLVVLTLTGIGLAVLVLAVRSGMRHYSSQRAVLSRLHVQYESTYRGRGLTVFVHEHPEAFCAGLLRPRLYLSTAAMQTIDGAGLAAVMEHELHHCRRRDPLRLLIAQILSESLFFLPAMMRLHERYRTLAELAADEAAVNGGSSGALARALLAFAEGTRPGVVGIAPERVDHLFGEDPRWRLPAWVLAGTLITLTGLLAVALGLIYTVAPGDLSISVLSSQACMVLMSVVPGACGNPMDMVPFAIGMALVIVAYRRRRQSAMSKAVDA